MLKFIYKDGINIVNPNTLPPNQSSKFHSMESTIGKAIAPLACAKHKSNSHVAIILNVGQATFNWEFADFCCDEFGQIVKSAITAPLNRAQRHRQA